MRKINQIFFLFVSLSCLCLVSCKDEESPQWTSIEGTFSDPIPSRKGAVVEGMIMVVLVVMLVFLVFYVHFLKS